MPHRQVRTALAALALCVVASPVSAQWSEDSRSFASRRGFGAKSQLSISAERIFGFVSSTETTEPGMLEISTTTQTIGFIAQGQASSPYSVPRLALDYFVADGVSVGGSIGYATSSSETETSGGGTSVTMEGDTTTTFLFTFRGGYAHMFSRSAGIWPRLGFTYHSVGSEDPDGNSEFTVSGLALGLEVQFVLSPVEHFAFTVGPSFDVGLGGSSEASNGGTSVETDTTITDIAITVGVLGWL